MFGMKVTQFSLIVLFNLYPRNCEAEVKCSVLQCALFIFKCGSNSVLFVLYCTSYDAGPGGRAV